MRAIASIPLVALLALAACGTTPEAHPADAMRGKRFVNGPEYRRASALQAQAIEEHRQAFLETDEDDRQALLASAFDLCGAAQDQYEKAMGRYPNHQREAIVFQMAAVHELMKEIQRDQP